MKKTKELSELFESDAVKSWRAITAVYRHVYSYLDQELQKSDLNISRMEILIILFLEGPARPVDLAKKMASSRANISMFLKRLTKDKILETFYEEGSKRALFALTKEGERLLKSHLKDHLKRVDSIMPLLSKQSLKRLSKVSNS